MEKGTHIFTAFILEPSPDGNHFDPVWNQTALGRCCFHVGQITGVTPKLTGHDVSNQMPAVQAGSRAERVGKPVINQLELPRIDLTPSFRPHRQRNRKKQKSVFTILEVSQQCFL